ncbi:MAG TPA: UDP-2,3-diacylglucosamine diphosphatase [Burkholderiales bacterium]|nr:UDP-2,3-diacylglucosamine diphosphatase [Burkholderiales bacterium]HYA47623.1 UDP-2,3-diacylglucosamine diphosphatase [Burkholderiales bacterium]
MARVLFASDLHLATARPAAVDRFLRFVAEDAARADALYVLGDLFEYWIGDDELSAPDGDPLAKQVAATFRALTRGGVPLYFMHGNRDFLVGEAFARDCGANLLADPAVREVEGVATLLMHGDTLCTDDRDYMAWRATARSEAWQRELLAAPLALRRERARALREQSETSKKGKTAEIMDVNAGAVREAFERHRVSRMIHGHTHRPGHHLLEIGGRTCERWVLPDWYEHDGYLLVEDGAARLVYF